MLDPRTIGAGAAVTLGREPGSIPPLDDYLPAYGVASKVTDWDRGPTDLDDPSKFTGPGFLSPTPGEKERNRSIRRGGVDITPTGHPGKVVDPKRYTADRQGRMMDLLRKQGRLK